GVVHPHLAAVDVAVAVDQRGPAVAQRFHLGPGQHDAGFPGVVDVVVVPGPLVGGDQLLLGSVVRCGLLRRRLLRRHRVPPSVLAGLSVSGRAARPDVPAYAEVITARDVISRATGAAGGFRRTGRG